VFRGGRLINNTVVADTAEIGGNLYAIGAIEHLSSTVTNNIIALAPTGSGVWIVEDPGADWFA
jgi:hypothetical protein